MWMWILSLIRGEHWNCDIEGCSRKVYTPPEEVWVVDSHAPMSRDCGHVHKWHRVESTPVCSKHLRMLERAMRETAS